MKQKYFFLFFIALFFIDCAKASVETNFKECEAIANDDFALDECYSTAIAEYDKIIQKTMNDILKSGIEENFKNDLRNSQRAWINYKEMTSKVLFEAQDGIAASLIASDFILKSSKQQADILLDIKKTLGL